jgi:hypothetical protein
VLVELWLSYRAVRPARASPSFRRGVWMLAGLALFQGYHALEHVAKLYQYLFMPLYQSGAVPTPGLLPPLTGWPIFLVHFWLNTIVWLAMIVALWHVRPDTVARSSVPARGTAGRR